MTDIESILKQMTLEEKAALCTGTGPWTTVPIERLGWTAWGETSISFECKTVPFCDDFVTGKTHSN